jgi:hypothetical protein
MLSLFGQKCPACGKDIPGNASFCPDCGSATTRGNVTCGKCGAQNRADARFCHQCGEQLSRNVPPTVGGNQWRRGPNDFVTRVEIGDLKGFFARDLIVEPGTHAMLVADGQNVGVVGPGPYTMQTLADRIPILNTLIGGGKSMSALLADTSDVRLDFNVAELRTKDPLKIAVKCSVVLQLESQVLFIVNVMKDQRSYPLPALRDYLFDEVRDAAQEFISGRGAEELSSNLALKQQLEMQMEAHLRRTLERTGLRLVQVQTTDYLMERFDKIRNIQEEYFLQITEEAAQNQGRKRLFDVIKEKWLQELAEETAKVEVFEQRAAVWERMRQAVMSDRMSQIHGEDEFAAFMQEQDKQKLIRAEEWDALKREFSEKRADQDSLRAFMVAKLEMERDYELKQRELSLRNDLTTADIEFELQVERKRLQGRIDLESQRWEADNKRRIAEADSVREQARLAEIAERQKQIENSQAAAAVRLTQAKTQADIGAIEREQDRLDMELGMLGLERMKAIHRADDLRAQETELARRRAELEMDLQRQRAQMDIELQKMRELHEQEIKRLQTLGQLGSDALIAAAGPEQARLLAELKLTEALKGMTEEQILARAAEKSPEVAQAFVEKFRAMAAAQQPKQFQELYERMLAEQKAMAQSSAESHDRNAERMQTMFVKAMETQRDTATAFARGGNQPPMIITSGGGLPSVVMPGTAGAVSGQVVICQKCHTPAPVGTKHCTNCGAAFF